MFKQAISLFTYRKKSTILMTILFAFVFFLLGSVPALFTEKAHLWFQGEADYRGIFDGIYFDLSAEQKEKLLANDRVENLGFIFHYGEYEIAEIGGDLSVGSLDQTAIELGRIDMAEGRLPAAEGEIALENAWRNRLPEGVGVGSAIHLITPTGEKTYTLCGFIENYTEGWTLNVSASIKQPPNAFVSGEGAPGEVTQTDALVYMVRLQEAEDTHLGLTRLASLIGLQGSQVSYNELLYDSPAEYGVFQSVFILAILAGVITVSYISLSFYVESYTDTARKLYASGATKKGTLKLLLLWVTLLSAGALLLSFGLHAIFSAVTKTYLQISIPLARSLLPTVLSLLGVAALTVWFHKKKIAPLYGASLSKQNEQTANTEILLKRHMNFSFAMRRAKEGKKRLWGVYISVAIILALFLCVREDVNNRLGLSFPGGILTLRADMRTLTKEEETTFGDFVLTKEKSGFRAEDVTAFLGMPGVKYADLHYMGMHASLLLKDRDSAYAQALYEQDAHQKNAVPAVPEGTRAIVMAEDEYNILVLDEQGIVRLKSRYPDIDAEKALAAGNAIVFCNSIRTELGTSVNNDLFEKGGEIAFGWLEAEDSYEAALQDPTLIHYEEESFRISEVIENTLSGWPPDFSKVAVVISEETAESTRLCSLVSYLNISVGESITKEEYNAIKTRLGEMVDKAFGMQLEESKLNIPYDQEVVKAVIFVRDILIVILSAFMLYAVSSVLYCSFAQYRKSFGILRASGYRKRALFSTILQEFLLYWALLVGVCYVAVLGIESIYFPTFVYDYWYNLGSGFPYIFRTVNVEVGIFAAATFFICLLAAGLFTEGLWKKSAASSIRFSE